MLIYIHIPKNAGTTFNSILINNFKNKYYDFHTDRNGNFLSQQELVDLINDQKNNTAVISGHDIRPYEIDDKVGIKLDYITFIRDPIGRAISLYYHERAHSNKNHISQYSFKEYIKERPSHDNAISNWQTFNIVDDSKFESAKTKLDNFVFVGLVEEFDKSLILLQKVIKEKLHINNFNIIYTKKNVSRNKKIDKQNLDRSVIETLTELNQEDHKLYSYAKCKLSGSIKEIENFDKTLTTFKYKNKIYELRTKISFKKLKSFARKSFCS
jgi:hypothetical protein